MIANTSESDTLNLVAGQSRGDWIGAYAPDWAADCPKGSIHIERDAGTRIVLEFST